jgi:hypothetical protein
MQDLDNFITDKFISVLHHQYNLNIEMGMITAAKRPFNILAVESHLKNEIDSIRKTSLPYNIKLQAIRDKENKQKLKISRIIEMYIHFIMEGKGRTYRLSHRELTLSDAETTLAKQKVKNSNAKCDIYPC